MAAVEHLAGLEVDISLWLTAATLDGLVTETAGIGTEAGDVVRPDDRVDYVVDDDCIHGFLLFKLILRSP